MTNSTADSSETGLFETPFSIGAVVVSVLSLIIGIVVLWTGYQDSELMVVGSEPSIVTGLAGFMFASFVALVALVAAIYMEPGFDH